MVLVQGENGQGKSNLLEAIYILAIAKSPRTSADRELVRRQSAREEPYSQVSAVVCRDGEDVRVQIDFMSVPTPSEEGGGPENHQAQRPEPEGISVQKYIRVNGVPRRASELVGHVNAVMFSAHDLELVYGPPTVRRRYLDIVISQSDTQYLRALQRYHRITYQRNHLLRMVRARRSGIDELGFWDDRLINEGKQITARRLSSVRRLSDLAAPIHQELTGKGESLELLYRPSVPVGADGSEDGLAQSLRRAIEAQREREIAQGVTVTGPHRDDLQLLVDGMDAGAYASRGQSRTAVLAMKLAEARYLTDQRQVEPILLLDDVLSELDAPRRAHVLERVSQYRQCFITTTDPDSVEQRFLSGMRRLVVHRGQVEAG